MKKLILIFTLCIFCLHSLIAQTYKVYDDSTHKTGFVIYDASFSKATPHQEARFVTYDANRLPEYSNKQAIHIVDSINKVTGGGWHLPTEKQAIALDGQMFGFYQDKIDTTNLFANKYGGTHGKAMSFQMINMNKFNQFKQGRCTDCAPISATDYWVLCTSCLVQNGIMLDYNKYNNLPGIAHFGSVNFFNITAPHHIDETHKIFLVKDF